MDRKHQKPGEVSKVLGVTGVTVRHYVKEFRQFLSAGATSDTNRKFTPEDVQVLKVARSLLSEGFTYEEVRHQLEERLPLEGEVWTGDVEPEQEPAFQEPSAIQPLEFFTAFVDALKEEHQSTIQAKDEHLETLRLENERLKAEVDWFRLPFFIRWFRKRS